MNFHGGPHFLLDLVEDFFAFDFFLGLDFFLAVAFVAVFFEADFFCDLPNAAFQFSEYFSVVPECSTVTSIPFAFAKSSWRAIRFAHLRRFHLPVKQMPPGGQGERTYCLSFLPRWFENALRLSRWVNGSPPPRSCRCGQPVN